MIPLEFVSSRQNPCQRPECDDSGAGNRQLSDYVRQVIRRLPEFHRAVDYLPRDPDVLLPTDSSFYDRPPCVHRSRCWPIDPARTTRGGRAFVIVKVKQQWDSPVPSFVHWFASGSARRLMIGVSSCVSSSCTQSITSFCSQ